MTCTPTTRWTTLALGVAAMAALAACGDNSVEPERQRQVADQREYEGASAVEANRTCRETANDSNRTAPAPDAGSVGGGRIAFLATPKPRSELNTEIYVMNPDGSDQTQVTDTPRAAEESLTWSPDGDRIAFGRFEGKQSDIWVMNPDGSDQVNLTETPEVIESIPAWSPDGERIAFSSSEPSDIWVMNPDGSDQVNLTDTPEVRESRAAWSPDGKEIAFNLERPRKSDPSTSVGGIYAMDADGSDQRPLTGGPEFRRVYPASPTYFPDGERFAFLGQCRGAPGWVIWTMGADGSDPAPLESVARSEPSAPAISADGERIAFGGGTDVDGIFVMNADGSDQIALTNGLGDSYPVWSPVLEAP